MKLTEEELYATLKKQFYINVDFALDKQKIEEAIQSFFKFLNEPDSVKQHIYYKLSDIHRRGDVGFTHRQSSEDQYRDNKDFFHFHPSIFRKYPEFLENHPVVNDFMIKANSIWNLAHDKVKEILTLFENKFPGIVDRVFDTEYVHIQLRFLKYEWPESGKYLAKPHFDAGSFTLAIAESSAGLRIGSNPDNLKLVEHQENNAIFMISSNFRKVMDTDDLSPGWHDVIQLDETLIGKFCARWAIVAFIEATGVEALSRSETHKYYKDE